MKLHYYPETDTLYISLSEGPCAETDEIAEDFIVDYAEDGSPLGFEIEHASQRVDLTEVETRSFSYSERRFTRAFEVGKSGANRGRAAG